jgi:hypothetical protein
MPLRPERESWDDGGEALETTDVVHLERSLLFLVYNREPDFLPFNGRYSASDVALRRIAAGDERW